MKQIFLSTKPYKYCGLLVFIVLLTNGCRSEEAPFTQERTPEVANLSTLPPTSTETVMIATNTSTPIPTTADESTTVPSATSTAMPVPTLTDMEAEAVFENFMATNGGCELPCWWGFQLGDSLESVSQTFSNLGMPWLEIGSIPKVGSDQMGTWDASYYDQNEGYVVARLSVHTQFHELDGSIQYIYVFVNRVKFEESQQEFIRDWEQYYLSSFLQRYGKPTQVYFRLRSVADVMDPPQFSVSLLYREKGLAITYHIKGVWLDDQSGMAELCLDMENAQAIELSLFNPDNFDIWGYQFAPYHDELYEPLTWEAEIGMPLDTFYETYQNPENLNCLVVNSR